ncbi:MAG TPA: D-aminoacyl-tRNA deacylase [Burkholderiaceae bacterium]|nr:D-aminoacyl-tRNA deacylase [Burkholderiaceae bacterium]
MIGLLQRVRQAHVQVDGERIGAIEAGLLVLICAERGDEAAQADTLIERLVNYRVFADDAGRMSRSLRDVRGGLLLVPQFTLAADTRSGTRPSFTPAAPPDKARELFGYTVSLARERYGIDLASIETGRFGAYMQIGLVNDGPVTFWLQVSPPRKELG